MTDITKQRRHTAEDRQIKGHGAVSVRSLAVSLACVMVPEVDCSTKGSVAMTETTTGEAQRLRVIVS